MSAWAMYAMRSVPGRVVSEVAITLKLQTKQLAMDSAETASDIQIAATVCTEPVLSWDERHLFFRSHLPSCSGAYGVCPGATAE